MSRAAATAALSLSNVASSSRPNCKVAAAVARLIISIFTVPSDTARLSASVAASASLTPSLKVLTRAAHSLKPLLIPAVPMLPKGVRVFIASPIARICSRVMLR